MGTHRAGIPIDTGRQGLCLEISAITDLCQLNNAIAGAGGEAWRALSAGHLVNAIRPCPLELDHCVGGHCHWGVPAL